VTKPDPCRFCRIFAIAVVAFAALVGAVSTAQMGFGLRKFGGYEYVMRVVVLSSVRSLAPGVTGSALLVAFVVWAHPLPLPLLQQDLPRLLKRALLVSLPGYLVAAIIAIGAGLLVAHFALGVPWADGRRAFGFLRWSDAGAGALGTLVDAGLIVFLAWRYLARLQMGRSSLPMKLVLAWTFGTGLRITLGLIVSLLLPG
jgi:ABC-type transporter Mla maintaining outer membrane lipid asymmetry permease subunit MlaE